MGLLHKTIFIVGCNAKRFEAATDNKIEYKLIGVSRSAFVFLLMMSLSLASYSNSEEKFDIDIPSTTASFALDALAEKTNHSLFYPAHKIRNIKVNALVGSFSLSEALLHLLKDTGLKAVVTKKRVILVSYDPNKDGNNESGDDDMKKNKKTLASTMATILAGGMSQGGLAQEFEDVGFALEEVVVTAERREVSLQDTPISIIAFQGADLERIGVNGVQELHNFLPNVSIGLAAASGGESNFSIRGIGSARSSGVGERGVGLYIDDIYFGRSEAGALLKLTDVDRVEVLRGPQGTLFGRNNTGGAIRYITRKPSDEYEGRFTAKVGSYNRKDLEAVLNIPFSDNFKGRFNYASFDRDGHVTTDNTFVNELMAENEIYDLGDENIQVARAAFRFEPSDNLTIDFSASHTSGESNARAIRITQVFPGVCPGSSAFGVCYWDRALAEVGEGPIVTDDPRFVFNDPSRTSPTGDKVSEVETLVTALDVSWQISENINLNSTTGFLDTSTEGGVDISGFGVQSRLQERSSDSLQQEFRLGGRSMGDKLDWVVGAFYFTEDPVEQDALYGVASGTGGPPWAVPNQGRTRDRKYGSDSLGIFGQGTYAITDAVNLTAGLRKSYDERFISQQRSNRCDAVTFTNEADFDSLDYRVSVDVALTENIMTYATVSKGYKAGGFNDGIDRARTFEPHRVLYGLQGYSA